MQESLAAGAAHVTKDKLTARLKMSQAEVATLAAQKKQVQSQLETVHSSISDAKGRIEASLIEHPRCAWRSSFLFKHLARYVNVMLEKQTSTTFINNRMSRCQSTVFESCGCNSFACSVPSKEMQKSAQAAQCALAKAQTVLRRCETQSNTAEAKLLARCPAISDSCAVPALSAFTFDLSQRAAIEKCSTALSLCLAPYRDLLLVPHMADVKRYGKCDADWLASVYAHLSASCALCRRKLFFLAKSHKSTCIDAACAADCSSLL
jgi:hypothetical protein